MSEFVPEGWKLKTIGELANVKRGASPRPINDSQWWGGNVGWVRISDVTSSNKYLNKTTQYLSDLGVSKSVKIDKGEVVLSICATIGKPIIVNVDACIHDGFVWFNKLEKTIHREFWYYFLLSNQEFLASQRQSGTQGNLNTSIVSDLLCYLPPLPEQQKIAAILTSVDEVIEKTQAQINKLKDLKTGMMQELLTRGVGVDGKPHTEFKDSPVGRIPKGWAVVKLSDTGKWKGGGTPSKSNKNYWSGSIPWVSPKDMKLDLISRTKDLITEDAIKGSSTNLITKNSLLMVVRSGILQHTLPVAIAACDLTINQDMKALSVSKGYCVNFIFYYLQAHNHTVLRATLKAGNTVESIDFNEFGKYLIPSPSLEEQVRISDVIASISNKIKVKEYKLSSLKNTKKALMQDLLTGKVRVKVDS